MSLPVCAQMDSYWTFALTLLCVIGPMLLSHVLRMGTEEELTNLQ